MARSHQYDRDSGMILTKILLVILMLVVAILAIAGGVYYYYTPKSQTGTQFDMVGTFEIVQVPCASGQQCRPQYQLATADGNSYRLIFPSLCSCPTGETCDCPAQSTLPAQGQRIEVKGTISYNTQGSCMLNGQPTPCQPIGAVIVSSWTPA